MFKRVCFWMIMLFFVLTIPAYAKVAVTDVFMAEDVDNKSPVNVGKAFPASLGKLYCFSRITGMEVTPGVADEEAPLVYHVWLMKKGEEFQEMARVPLKIKSRSWRTRSRKTLLKSSVGEWQVRIIDENENELHRVSFQIIP